MTPWRHVAPTHLISQETVERNFFIIRINFKAAQTAHKIYLTNNNPLPFAEIYRLFKYE